MRIALQNFTGGEVAPTLSARYDLSRYRNSVGCMENMLPGLHGDVKRRPGTRFVADLGEYCVLLPFSFNSDSSQNFVLIFGNKSLRIGNANGLIADVPTIETPYQAEHLLELSHAQMGDVVYLAHRSYPLHKVVRRDAEGGGYAWSLEEVALNTSLPAPTAPTVAFIRGNSDDTAALEYTLRYKVVAVDANGKESLASPAGETLGKHPSDWVQGNHVSITWTAVEDAAEYNVYREEAGYFGFIGVYNAGNAYTPPTEEQQQALQNLLSAAQTKEAQRDQAKAEYDRLRTNYDAQCYITDSETGSTTESTTQACRNLKAQRESALANYNALASEASSLRGQYNTLYGQVYPKYSFTDNNYEADTSDTPREDWDPFKDGNNPGVVAFHQQRMVLGGTPKAPQAFYMSRTGDFENFRKSRPLQDDDPVEYLIASGSIDAITWAASFGDLLIGTSGSEYKASGGDGSALTAKNIAITAQSYWGSAELAPIIIGNSVLHVQRHGARVRDLFYSLEKDGYAGNDLSIMAPHLFDGYSLKQWAYQQTPGSTIWIVRDDGLLLALTYMKEHDIWGWSRHITDGEFLSVASISGESEDVIMAVVKREIGGLPRYFLERLVPHWNESENVREAFYLDCGHTQRTETPDTEVTGLDHLEGKSVVVLADGSPLQGLTVRDGRIEISYPASVIHVGLPFDSVLSPLPIEADTQTGSTLGKMRGYGRCALRLHRSVGVKYGPRRDELYDIPFIPERWGEPVPLESGDLDFIPGGGQESQATIWLVQDLPLPMQIVALMLDVDFGEQ